MRSPFLRMPKINILGAALSSWCGAHRHIIPSLRRVGNHSRIGLLLSIFVSVCSCPSSDNIQKNMSLPLSMIDNLKEASAKIAATFGHESKEARIVGYATTALANFGSVAQYVTEMTNSSDGLSISFNIKKYLQKFIFATDQYRDPAQQGAICYKQTSRTHDDGWTISGTPYGLHCMIQMDAFEAAHPELGTVSGNFNSKVTASSPQAYYSFVAAHAPIAISMYAD